MSVFKFWYVVESTEVRRGELQQALSICNRRHKEIESLLHLCHLGLLENPQSRGIGSGSDSCYPGHSTVQIDSGHEGSWIRLFV